ncbi:MAG: glycosyltransferase [Cellulosilyticaceae bacterium]
MNYRLNTSVNPLAYMSNPNHSYLATWDLRDNIGVDQSQLTIVILSLNRIQLTKELLNSLKTHIPHFNGKILIMDNGSSPSSIKELSQFLRTFPFSSQLVELHNNYGISGGRNRSIPYVSTEWIMFLDNDIYFTDNPFPAARDAISQLGCHFLNMPLRDASGNYISALGGHLDITLTSDIPQITCRSAYSGNTTNALEVEPFLSTHVHGGSNIIKKSTFQALGGFDDTIFIGYEDVDLSIRIYNAGLKIGNCGKLYLIHNHVSQDTTEDKTYEQIRFSLERIKSCADYFRTKHNLNIWDEETEYAITQRLETLSKPQPIAGTSNTNLPKIALVVDVPNWAFHHIAQQIQRHLSNDFEIKVIFASELSSIWDLFPEVMNYDLIHFFWRPHLLELLSPNAYKYLASRGITKQDYLNLLKKVKLSTAVYDHLYLESRELQKYQPAFHIVSGYYVSSNKLYNIYNALPRCPHPVCTIHDGIDLSVFSPSHLERLDCSSSDPLIIGWAGNSNWNSPSAGSKGVHTILKPAVAELQQEGYAITLLLADSQGNRRHHSEMPSFYNQLHVYVCTSSTEGTPNPVLEAMACGVPIISTNVGIVPDILGPIQQKYILAERSVEALKQKLCILYDNRHLLRALSQENLNLIKNYSWEKQTALFKLYFNQIIG